jgi:hypothetical protein
MEDDNALLKKHFLMMHLYNIDAYIHIYIYIYIYIEGWCTAQKILSHDAFIHYTYTYTNIYILKSKTTRAHMHTHTHT